MVSLVDSDGSAVNYTFSTGSDLPMDLPQQFVTTIGGQEITLVQQPDGEDGIKFVQVWRVLSWFSKCRSKKSLLQIVHCFRSKSRFIAIGKPDLDTVKSIDDIKFMANG
jgi:hypothetical protein